MTEPKIQLIGEEQVAQREVDLSGTAHGLLKVARRIVSMDELVRMTNVAPQLEKEMKLPGDVRGATNTVFMFSINGVLDGAVLRGVLLAGECMLVQARSLKQAERTCKEGLRDTIRFARDELEQRSAIEVAPASVLEAGTGVDAHGKHGLQQAGQELLKSDPVLRNILAAEIGKIKWKQ